MRSKKSIVISLSLATALALSACGNVNSRAELLAAPPSPVPLSYEQRSDSGLNAYRAKSNAFAAKFAEQTFTGQNYAVSPVSVYMGLTLAARCADGNTADELYSALDVNEQQAAQYFPLLYRSLNEQYTMTSYERDRVKKVIGHLAVSNSVWLNESCAAKEDCVTDLAQRYFCYPFSADFANDNADANNAVREFVRDKTRGLIDKDFSLSPATVFSLINTLYLKDVWMDDGADLPLTDNAYVFTGKRASTEVRLMIGKYITGQIYTENAFSAFFTSTYNGNKIKFIVPNDGYTIEQAFTAENIQKVNDYGFAASGYDEENRLIYNTNCLFPQFDANYDDDIAPVLNSQFGIRDLFSAEACDLGALTANRAYCSKVKHVTELKVDRKGIEGAAVMITEMVGSAAGDGQWTNVYQTFTVDKNFGFVVTDSNDTVLFAGAITDLRY